MSSATNTPITRSRARLAVAVSGVVVLLLAINVASAAASSGAAWAIQSVALPTSFSASHNEGCASDGYCDAYLVTATNVGTTSTKGPIVLTDTFPAGIVVKGLREPEPGEFEPQRTQGNAMTCPAEYREREEKAEDLPSVVHCEYSQPVLPGDVLVFKVNVAVSGASGSVSNHAEIAGGEAATVATSEPSTVANSVNGEAAAFGVQDFAMGVYGSTGAGDVQAGAHPDALTTTIDYETLLDPQEREEQRFVAVREPKTEIIDLPLGFVGDPLVTPQCPESDLYRSDRCPPASQIGVITVRQGAHDTLQKVFNMVPEAGYPAVFGFEYEGFDVFMRARLVPSAAGYLLSISVPDIPRALSAKVSGVTLLVFGDPAEVTGGSSPPAAFLANPTDCSSPEPLRAADASLELDSWVRPEEWSSAETTMYAASPGQAVSGCDMLQFDPTVEVKPEETHADTPSGYEVDLKVPQAPNLEPALATPDLRNAQLSLPEGVSVSPGAADGLLACHEAGPEGINITHGWTPTGEQPLDPADPEAMEIGPDELPHIAAGHCPQASQIGTVEILTPLLSNPLHGHVYVAEPLCGGAGQPACSDSEALDGNLFRLYLEAEGSGVIVKLEGRISANPSTGQLTTTFKENPQLPFSELKLDLNGGPRAPLSNPQSCGVATTTSVLEPWSAPESGPAATPFSSFAVTGCGASMPFAPGFLAQTEMPRAGAYSPFTTTFSRNDGEQDLAGITVGTPPGLLGMLSEVALCPEPQASQGACGPQSQIGHAHVAAGAGSHPFWETGSVFLTGPYKGQPFGLSIVTPTTAGPFNLGNVIVRAAIHVDPYTAALSVTSDPLPRIIDGVPLRLKTVNVTIDKPGFMFNPTNCAAQAVTGTIAGALANGAAGASVAVSSPFAAAGCEDLPFTPKLTALTQAKTSKADGAYLHVKVTSGAGEANIAKTTLVFPKVLPSRLTTLQKACLAAVFEANPASCPEGSVIGTATVHTPVLKSPLAGPAYLVSHGGAAFPDVEFVLQGEGVTLILDGKTDIKKGVTSSTFNAVPDAPFTSFDAVLPEGPHSIFAAYGSLCSTRTVTVHRRVALRRHGQLVRRDGRVVHVRKTSKRLVAVAKSLAMPTTITGQNGAVIKQTTKIAVEGCHAVKSAKSRKKPQHHRKGKRKRS